MYRTRKHPDVIIYIRDRWVESVVVRNPALYFARYRLKLVKSIEGLELDPQGNIKRLLGMIHRTRKP